MDIISAYREAGTFRGAAVISGTTPKTVKRVIARHEAGGGAPVRSPRERNYDIVAGLVAERLFVSPNTVGTHVRHVFEKLGVRSRTELAGRIARHARP